LVINTDKWPAAVFRRSGKSDGKFIYLRLNVQSLASKQHQWKPGIPKVLDLPREGDL
jgi:hypothetical protein